MRRLPAAAAALVLGAAAGLAAAQEPCAAPASAWDLDANGIDALYACVAGRMVEGYVRGGDAVAGAYRGWTRASIRPAVAGPHGERLINTFVNGIGAAQYLAFEQGAFVMPVGSVIAKESISIDGGEARAGPLFTMTKVTDAPETGDWRFDAIGPDGDAMRIGQGFCHECHGKFEASDSLGYPLEEVRAGAR